MLLVPQADAGHVPTLQSVSDSAANAGSAIAYSLPLQRRTLSNPSDQITWCVLHLASCFCLTFDHLRRAR